MSQRHYIFEAGEILVVRLYFPRVIKYSRTNTVRLEPLLLNNSHKRVANSKVRNHVQFVSNASCEQLSVLFDIVNSKLHLLKIMLPAKFITEVTPKTLNISIIHFYFFG